MKKRGGFEGFTSEPRMVFSLSDEEQSVLLESEGLTLHDRRIGAARPGEHVLAEGSKGVYEVYVEKTQKARSGMDETDIDFVVYLRRRVRNLK